MRTIAIVVSIVLLLLMIVGYRLFNKQHRSVENEEFVRVEATQLFEAFEDDEIKANQVYLDKVVQVSGRLSEILVNQAGEPVLVLETGNELYGVSCTMVSKPENIVPGVEVTIKGICTGYLSDVIITRGILMIDNAMYYGSGQDEE